MDVGVIIPHFGPLASPEFVIDFCRAAEAAGFDAAVGRRPRRGPEPSSSRSMSCRPRPSASSLPTCRRPWD